MTEKLGSLPLPAMPKGASPPLTDILGIFRLLNILPILKGKKPLICIGINPSTARPDALDNTLKSVERTALFNGYDSFLMFNLYAQRATDPDYMERTFNSLLHRQNMAAFTYILENAGRQPAIWAAWGTIIEKREYLFDCMAEMVSLGEQYGAQWYTCGKRSAKGHPHHPLYLKKNSPLEEFDIAEYLECTRTKKPPEAKACADFFSRIDITSGKRKERMRS